MIVLKGVYTRAPTEWNIAEEGEPDCFEIMGAIMTVQDYLECVKDRSLTDYDGYGHPMKDGFEDPQLHIWPSELNRHIPLDATHIIWFNK